MDCLDPSWRLFSKIHQLSTVSLQRFILPVAYAPGRPPKIYEQYAPDDFKEVHKMPSFDHVDLRTDQQ